MIIESEDELRARFDRGEYIELDCEIVGFAQGPGVAHANHEHGQCSFDVDGFDSLAKTAPGRPFLSHHDRTRRGGTIISAELRRDRLLELLVRVHMFDQTFVRSTLHREITRASIAYTELQAYCAECGPAVNSITTGPRVCSGAVLTEVSAAAVGAVSTARFVTVREASPTFAAIGALAVMRREADAFAVYSNDRPGWTHLLDLERMNADLTRDLRAEKRLEVA